MIENILKMLENLLNILENIFKLIVRYYDIFLEGMGMTILLAFITVFIGTILGTLIAFMRLSKNKGIKIIAQIYVEVVRGIPLLLQLWVVYLLANVYFGKFIAVSIALTVNSAAYVSEIVRAGIQAVDKGQTEAARSLGINSKNTMLKVILPQAIKNILPALGNEFVTVIKETSLASVFFIGDLMTKKNIITSLTYLALEPYIIIGLIYLTLTFTLSKLVGKLEKRLMNSD